MIPIVTRVFGTILKGWKRAGEVENRSGLNIEKCPGDYRAKLLPGVKWNNCHWFARNNHQSLGKGIFVFDSHQQDLTQVQWSERRLKVGIRSGEGRARALPVIDPLSLRVVVSTISLMLASLLLLFLTRIVKHILIECTDLAHIRKTFYSANNVGLMNLAGFGPKTGSRHVCLIKSLVRGQENLEIREHVETIHTAILWKPNNERKKRRG